jgi:hypothetical protein
MTTPPHDAPRNTALADAVSRIEAFASDELAKLPATTATPLDFYFIAHNRTDFEMAGDVNDFDAMALTFAQIIAVWVEIGLCTEDPGDDDPLFTATFDPTKARLS